MSYSTLEQNTIFRPGRKLNTSYTVVSLFEKACLEFPERIAIKFDDDAYTYKEFEKIINRIASNLFAEGISKGSRVALILPNCKEYIFLYFALFRIGAIAVPLCTRWVEAEIKNVLLDAKVDSIIYSNHIGVTDFDKIINNIKPDLTELKKLFVLKSGTVEFFYNDSFKDLGEIFTKDNSNLILTVIKPEDLILISYTSGTTGKPKGVMLTHGNFAYTSKALKEMWVPEGENTEEDVLSLAPMYGGMGICAILADLLAGATAHFLSAVTANEILKEVSKGHVNIIHTQPTMWSMLLSSTVIGFCNFSSLNLVIVNGSVCPPSLARQIEETVGCPVVNLYGLIEASGAVTTTRREDPVQVRWNTVGKAMPSFELKIVDQERIEVAKDEVGELVVRGYLMDGYFNNEEKTNEVIDENGWLYTGDLAKYHDDGENIIIIGRTKEMIIRGGFNIYPVDIEDVILESKKVEQAAVVGKPHEAVGEQTIAFVVPKVKESITSREIFAICKESLANYKIPDQIYIISEMPISENGKIRKNVLEEWAVNGIPEGLIMQK